MKNYEKIEQYNTEATDILSNNYKTIIENLGEDVTREGLEKTPERVAKAMQYLTHGYGLDPLQILKSALFTEDHQQMIVVKDIEVYSMCEHHMLPFFGKAHVADICAQPNSCTDADRDQDNITATQIAGVETADQIGDAFCGWEAFIDVFCIVQIIDQNEGVSCICASVRANRWASPIDWLLTFHAVAERAGTITNAD